MAPGARCPRQPLPHRPPLHIRNIGRRDSSDDDALRGDNQRVTEAHSAAGASFGAFRELSRALAAKMQQAQQQKPNPFDPRRVARWFKEEPAGAVAGDWANLIKLYLEHLRDRRELARFVAEEQLEVCLWLLGPVSSNPGPEWDSGVGQWCMELGG